MTTLRKGSRGAEVKTLQSYLHLAQDGIFGSITEEAVKQYQQQHNLLVTGVVGTAMWELLTAGNKLATRKINSIILHCSATPEGMDYTVSDIDRWHRQRGWAGIGYHYVIYRDGTVHPGRDINKVGAHCEGHNTGSIGICYIGGLTNDGKQTAKDTRTAAQRSALVSLVKKLMADYKLTAQQVHCHNEYAKKACPSFSIGTFRKDI